MIQVLVKVAGGLAVVFLALVLVARAMGGTQPPHPALRGFAEGCEGKPQPCWYGIVPGVTEVGTAEEALIDAGYHVQRLYGISMVQLEALAPTFPCRVIIEFDTRYTENNIYSLNFEECETIQVGHVIQEFGRPNGLCVYYTEYGIVFRDGYVGTRLGDESPLTPYSKIRTLRFYDSPRSMPMPWKGFRPFSHYLVDNPERGICR